MKDKNKDKFETFFRESLQTYGEDPSNLVWENLEPNIPKPESKKKPFWGWFFALAMLMLFMGGYWLKYDARMKNVQQAIQEQEIQLKNISNEVEKLNNNFSEQKINHSTIKENTSEENKSTLNKFKKQIETAITNNKQNISKSKKHNTFRTNKNYNNTFTNIKEKANLIKKEKLELTVSTVENIKTPITFLPSPLKNMESVPSIFGILKTPKRSLNPIDLIDYIGPSFKPSFEIFNYIGTTYPHIDLESPINSKKRDAMNFDFGILYNIPINQKWELQIGLGYAKRTIGTNFTKTFFYNSESLVNTNLYQSENTFQINSNYGRQILTNYFTNTKMNDGLDIEEGDAYSASISIVRIQEYINVPLFIKYKWSNPNERLIWTLKAGINDRIHFSVNSPGEVSYSEISHPRLQHNNSEVENFAHGNTASRFGLEIVLGAGVEYKLHKNVSFMLEPMFKTNIWERTPVNPYSLGIYSGLRCTFNR